MLVRATKCALVLALSPLACVVPAGDLDDGAMVAAVSGEPAPPLVMACPPAVTCGPARRRCELDADEEACALAARCQRCFVLRHVPVLREAVPIPRWRP